jgi:hypothetical protein
MFHQENADSSVSWGSSGICLAQKSNQLRPTGIGDPCLRAVYDIAPVTWACSSKNGLEIGSAAWLRECHCGAHLACGHARQKALLLLLGTERKQEL